MTRADQPCGREPQILLTSPPTRRILAAESRERAVGALLRRSPLRRLWSAQLDRWDRRCASPCWCCCSWPFRRRRAGGGRRSSLRRRLPRIAPVITAVFGARLLATLLFGAVLLGPLSALVAPGGPLDRRWTMFGADCAAAAPIVAPMWVDWMPGQRFRPRSWSRSSCSVSPSASGPSPRQRGARPAARAARPRAPRYAPCPTTRDALRRRWLRSTFVSLPWGAAISLVLVTSRQATCWPPCSPGSSSHQDGAGLLRGGGAVRGSASRSCISWSSPTTIPRPRSPLEGFAVRARPPSPAPRRAAALDKGRTGRDPAAGAGPAPRSPWAVASCCRSSRRCTPPTSAAVRSASASRSSCSPAARPAGHPPCTRNSTRPPRPTWARS